MQALEMMDQIEDDSDAKVILRQILAMVHVI